MSAPPPTPVTGKPLTIGAVCKALAAEFPDISISKIRYLEDQKLLTPQRTRGGYRLYAPADVDRLRTILRLQRDEFLPLRVIRQELAAGRTADSVGAAGDGIASGPRRSQTFSVEVTGPGGRHTLDEVVAHTGAPPALVRELEEYGILGERQRTASQNGGEGADRVYDDTEREVVRAAAELARYGVAARNLRVLRSSADREAALLQQILAPGLRSRNPERRREAVEALEELAAVASHLKHLLLVRDLRRIAQ